MTSNFIYLFNRNNTFSFCGNAALSLSNAPRATRCFSNHMVSQYLSCSPSHTRSLSLDQSLHSVSSLVHSCFVSALLFWHLAKLNLIKLSRNQDEHIHCYSTLVCVSNRKIHVQTTSTVVYSDICMYNFRALQFYACKFTSSV